MQLTGVVHSGDLRRPLSTSLVRQERLGRLWEPRRDTGLPSRDSSDARESAVGSSPRPTSALGGRGGCRAGQRRSDGNPGSRHEAWARSSGRPRGTSS